MMCKCSFCCMKVLGLFPLRRTTEWTTLKDMLPAEGSIFFLFRVGKTLEHGHRSVLFLAKIMEYAHRFRLFLRKKVETVGRFQLFLWKTKETTLRMHLF